MEQQNKRKTIQIVIILLSVLLALSLIALAGTFLYNHWNHSSATVVVPDNLIASQTAMTATTTASADMTYDTATDSSRDVTADTVTATMATPAAATATQEAGGRHDTQQAISLALYNKQPEENTPFAVGNMFPGDAETKYYRVQVSYRNTVTVHYHADIRPGYDKLAEVLKVKITLLSGGQTLYDGLMRDMPKSLTHRLNAGDSTTDELYYEVTAYLDTGVGNEYQNKDLIADFRWWVEGEDTGRLEPSPITGDFQRLLPWILLMAASGTACVALLVVRKRREEEE